MSIRDLEYKDLSVPWSACTAGYDRQHWSAMSMISRCEALLRSRCESFKPVLAIRHYILQVEVYIYHVCHGKHFGRVYVCAGERCRAIIVHVSSA